MLSLNHQNKCKWFFALVRYCVVELKLNGTFVDNLISGLNSDKAVTHLMYLSRYGMRMVWELQCVISGSLGSTHDYFSFDYTKMALVLQGHSMAISFASR